VSRVTDPAAHTPDVDTLVQRLRTHIETDGLVVPHDEALAALSDLDATARDAREAHQDVIASNERARKAERSGRKAAEADRDRLREVLNKQHALLQTTASRVAELEAALRQVSDARLHNIPGVNPDGSVSSDSMAQTLARAALAGDGGGA
jgi:hypothetical protein